jgi:hypothetical protein
MTEDTTDKVNELISDAAVHRIRAALDAIAAVSAERDDAIAVIAEAREILIRGDSADPSGEAYRILSRIPEAGA